MRYSLVQPRRYSGSCVRKSADSLKLRRDIDNVFRQYFAEFSEHWVNLNIERLGMAELQVGIELRVRVTGRGDAFKSSALRRRGVRGRRYKIDRCCQRLAQIPSWTFVVWAAAQPILV